jgi:phage head maturation protease
MLHDRLLLRESAQTLETRDAIPRPRTFDAEHNTVEAVIATANPVRRQDQRGAYFEILSPAGLDVAAVRGVSVLDSHQQGGLDNVLGTIAEAWVDGDEVIGRIQFSTRPEVAPIIADIRAGIIGNMSIGYQVEAWRDGQTTTGERTRTAAKWSIREASFVAVPADRTARTRNLRDLGPSSGRAATNRAIRELCTRAGVDRIVTDDLIDRGASVEDARGVVLDQLVTRGRTPIMTAHNTQTVDNPEAYIRAAGEALMVRVDPAFRPSGVAHQFVGLSIPEIARTSLNRSGVTTAGMSVDTLITRALNTTSDFSLILADVVGRTLRASYTAAPSGLRQLARQTTAADFRKKHRLMLDSTGFVLEKVNEHGEFKHGTMAEGEETYAVDSFGKIFGITRKALVNDDLGAFTDISRRLGQAAAAFEAQFLVNLLVSNAGTGPTMEDADPLFHAAHGNVSGTGAAPSETTLSAARLAMRKQVGLGGGPIDCTPWAVLIPSDMETSVEKLLTQIRAITISDVNVFASLRLVVEPRLADSKRWYVVANPALMDGLEYSYLAGAPGPQVESRAGFEVDGVQVKVRLDYGAGFVESRGWYSNAGQ